MLFKGSPGKILLSSLFLVLCFVILQVESQCEPNCYSRRQRKCVACTRMFESSPGSGDSWESLGFGTKDPDNDKNKIDYRILLENKEPFMVKMDSWKADQ